MVVVVLLFYWEGEGSRYTRDHRFLGLVSKAKKSPTSYTPAFLDFSKNGVLVPVWCRRWDKKFRSCRWWSMRITTSEIHQAISRGRIHTGVIEKPPLVAIRVGRKGTSLESQVKFVASVSAIHSETNLSVIIIDISWKEDTILRENRESRWIRMLETSWSLD